MHSLIQTKYTFLRNIHLRLEFCLPYKNQFFKKKMCAHLFQYHSVSVLKIWATAWSFMDNEFSHSQRDESEYFEHDGLHTGFVFCVLCVDFNGKSIFGYDSYAKLFASSWRLNLVSHMVYEYIHWMLTKKTSMY